MPFVFGRRLELTLLPFSFFNNVRLPVKPNNNTPQPHEGDLEHLAYVERVRGTFPPAMLAKSKAPDATACFDAATGSVRVDLLVAREVAAKGESKVAARLKRRAPLKAKTSTPAAAALEEGRGVGERKEREREKPRG